MLRSISAVVVCVSMGFVCARASHGQTDDGFVQPGLALADVEAEDYSAIVFVGGWGSSMYQYDFPGDYSNSRIEDSDSTRLISLGTRESDQAMPKLPEARFDGTVIDTENPRGQPLNWTEHEKAYLAGNANTPAAIEGVADSVGSRGTYRKYELEKVSVSKFDQGPLAAKGESQKSQPARGQPQKQIVMRPLVARVDRQKARGTLLPTGQTAAGLKSNTSPRASYLKITMENVVITSISTGGGAQMFRPVQIPATKLARPSTGALRVGKISR